MAELPTGTVTFLYTDIEGSTARWERQPAAMPAVVERHDALIRQAVAAHQGHVFRTAGDGLCAAFATASAAVAAALAAQQVLHAEDWGETPLRVRMALHTGATEAHEGDYVGACLNRIARLLAATHGGQTLLSQATADLILDALPSVASVRDLGEHRLRDLVRSEHVYQLVHPDLPADFPPLRSLDAFPQNLPLQLTSFVGREPALAELRRLLTTTRLLTLTGTGGCGKTRLALQLATDLVDQEPDGVWLVELAPLADPDLVPQTVATVLSLREQPGQPLVATLVSLLKPKRLLLLLDNCEHLLDATASLAEALLRACPALTILTTSRELLGVAGEATWRVPSLTLPDPGQAPSGAELGGSEAVQLFVDRARLVQPGFAVTVANAAAVAQVCIRLDGIPLAIELAAARVTALTVEQVAARLDDRFRLLSGGRWTALRRQQTLKAAIDWSHELLTEPERALLRRLAVFAGGWTLEAAEGICAGEGIEVWQVVELLTRLVEKSLVVAEEYGEETRYRLLETIRQYAGEKLLVAGEAAAVRDRHRDWYLGLAERAMPELWSRDQLAWLDRLDSEHDNLRAALEWSHGQEDGAEAEVRLAGALGLFRLWRGYATEARVWLALALARSSGVTPTARARALNWAGWFESLHGDLTQARALLAEGLALARAVGDHGLTAILLRHLAIVAGAEGNEAEADALLEESLALARQAGAQREIAFGLHVLGMGRRRRGDNATARQFFEESLAVSRAAGERAGLAIALEQLGEIAIEVGDYVSARALFEESLTHARAIGFKRHINTGLGSLGDVALLEGDQAAAGDHYRASLVAARDWGDPYVVSQALIRLAGLCAARGQYQRAARLFGAGGDVRRGHPLRIYFTYLRYRYEQEMAATRAALGEAAFAAAWAAGQALTLEEAVAEALAEEGEHG